jgi:hypothetical protein
MMMPWTVVPVELGWAGVWAGDVTATGAAAVGAAAGTGVAGAGDWARTGSVRRQAAITTSSAGTNIDGLRNDIRTPKKSSKGIIQMRGPGTGREPKDRYRQLERSYLDSDSRTKATEK